MLGTTSYTSKIIGLFERNTECNGEALKNICEKAAKVAVPLEFFNNEPDGGLNFKELSVAEIMRQNIYPEFINSGLASRIYIPDDSEIVWKIPDEDIFINNIFSCIPTFGVSGRINFSLAADDASKRRVTGWALDSDNRPDYVCYCNCCSESKNTSCLPVNITDITLMDITLVKFDDIRKYVEVKANISEVFMPEVVSMVDENFRNEVAGMPHDRIPEEARTVPLCEGVYIYVSAYKSIDNATELIMSASVARKLPNTRHFHWTPYGGLTEIYDKAYRPPLIKEKENYHIVSLKEM